MCSHTIVAFFSTYDYLEFFCQFCGMIELSWGRVGDYWWTDSALLLEEPLCYGSNNKYLLVKTICYGSKYMHLVLETIAVMVVTTYT